MTDHGRSALTRKRIGATRMVAVLAVAITVAIVGQESWVEATHDVRVSEDVSRTKHNLAANPDILAVGTTEICVFCHTPHGANLAQAGQAPLWNRLLPEDTSYTVYDSPNFDAQDLTGTRRPKGVSLACLSCHDGTISFDSLINAPTSGGFYRGNRGAGPGPGSSVSNISSAGGGLVDPSDSTFREGFRNSIDFDKSTGFPGGLHDLVHGPGSGEGAEPFPNLGKDLRDDHPIGIEVPCNTDPQFAEMCRDMTTAKLDGGVDGTNVAFVSRTSPRQTMIWPVEKRDRLRLYPSTEQPGRYYVECASCHNPHAPRVSFLRLPSGVPGLVTTNLTPNDSTGSPGGRIWGAYPNAGGAICLSCHQK